MIESLAVLVFLFAAISAYGAGRRHGFAQGWESANQMNLLAERTTREAPKS